MFHSILLSIENHIFEEVKPNHGKKCFSMFLVKDYVRNACKKENWKTLLCLFCNIWTLFSLNFGFIHWQINVGDPNELVSILIPKEHNWFLLTHLMYLHYESSCLQRQWWTSFNAILWWIVSLLWEFFKLYEFKMKLILISYKLSVMRLAITGFKLIKFKFT